MSDLDGLINDLREMAEGIASLTPFHAERAAGFFASADYLSIFLQENPEYRFVADLIEACEAALEYFDATPSAHVGIKASERPIALLRAAIARVKGEPCEP